MYDNFVDEKTVRRRVLSQGRHILQSIIESYDSGMLDDPIQAANLCTLFALCIEGKVTASFDEQTATTKWSLTEDWTKHLREVERSIFESKVIKGPWEQTVEADTKN
tara:strand:+ start:2142 stop:2462 length:321 start_codon:yes stop_codon:yes gene_type:complete